MDSVQLADNGQRLIALHGIDECGKGLVGSLIEEIAEENDLWAMCQGFADRVKYSIAASFGIKKEDAIAWCDWLKTNGEIVVQKAGDFDLITIDGRQFIRDFATDGHREIFGDDFWVRQLLPIDSYARDKIWYDAERIAIARIQVITDLRFMSEAQSVSALNGEIWEITGRGTGWNGDFHGEVCNYYIDNSGTPAETKEHVREMLASPAVRWLPL